MSENRRRRRPSFLPKRSAGSRPRPGVYLMKDAQGRVIYVGKAKNLRSRAGSYFHKTAADDRRICDWIGEVADIDFLAADSEVDALLMEARLIKDIQPKHNHDLKDDKTFPYLQITTGEDFPRVKFTREPLDRGVKLYGPFPRAKSLRGAIQVLQQDLQVPHLLARHRGRRPALAVVPALPAALDRPVHRPVQPADRPRDLPHATSAGCGSSSTARRTSCSREMEEEMREASKALQFEKAARLRDEIKALKTSTCAAISPSTPSPRSSTSIPRKGLQGPAEGARPGVDRRARSTAWTSPTWAAPRRSARWSRSSTACRSSRATAATRSRASQGVDDFASIREVVSRRIQGLQERDEPFPDIFLIDGGKGQLSAALEAFEALKSHSADRHLAGQARGGDLRPRPVRPDRAEPPLVRPAAASIRPRRGPPVRPALSPHAPKKQETLGEES